MEEAFVIVDPKNGMLHFVGINRAIVITLNRGDLESVEGELGVPQDLDGTQKLLWIANLSVNGDSNSLATLQEMVQFASRNGEACIALRYHDDAALMDFFNRSKRKKM